MRVSTPVTGFSPSAIVHRYALILAELRVGPIGVFNIREATLLTADNGPGHVSIRQISARQVGTGQIRHLEVNLTMFAFLKFEFDTSASKAGGAKVGFLKIGAADHRPLKGDTFEVRPSNPCCRD